MVRKLDAPWATCPITENGYVRIVSQPAYGNQIAAVTAADVLKTFKQDASYVFWPDSISINDLAHFVPDRFGSPKRLTDHYLLALSLANAGVFATLDTKFATDAVIDGRSALLVVT